MNHILSDLEPKEVFHYFEEICAIPHGSTNTKKISDYLVSFAKEQKLRYIQDDTNNVIIFKDGSKGYESSAPVMLQGHMDMVCEKETGCEIDFQTDGLSLELKDGIISAKGTTLGGDDGIAVAYMLAILASDTIPHPPLEAVFTVDEEIGMLGAAALDCSPLKSRIMLNMDSEDEGHLLVSCAGGVTATAHLPYLKTTKEGIPATLSIKGLLGGHSGVEIDKGRANANMLLGRTLYQLSKALYFDLVSVEGGSKDNAIPREATAKLLFTKEQDYSAAAEHISRLEEIYQREYHATDAGITLSLTLGHSAQKFSASGNSGSNAAIAASTDSADTGNVATSTKDKLTKVSALNGETTEKIITALVTLPNGIQKMSHDIEGLVQTSLNLGILQTKEREITFSFAVRSNVSTEKEELTDRISCLMETLGGNVTLSGDYPAWEYKKDSPLRELMVSIFEKQYGKKPVIEALHAGVECGLFAGKMEELDCVSFGPDMKDIHTPKESMDVESVRRTWEYTLEILKNLK
ncbi:MAG: aminoacyl-histidine dipeptidase [Lachnospiraceae bacterium]|nr:aminoacyl-histidine dipeptidase [Lachnospiraceae bacterium]